MKDFIKKHNKKINIASFVFALIIGISIGSLIGNEKNNRTEQTEISPTQTKSEIQSPNQMRGLLLGFDEFDVASSTLVSAWELSYDLDNQQIQLMPLYPVIPINAPENLLDYLSPHEPILISSPELSTIKYHEMFSSYNLNWDFTLMMDRFALDHMIDTFSKLSVDSSTVLVDYLNSLEPSLPGINPSAALSYQRSIFEVFCENSNPFFTENWMELLKDLGSHFRIDLEFNEILILRDYVQNSTFDSSCKFSWQ